MSTGKISPIKKDYSNDSFLTIDSSLAKHGYVRAPGTGRVFLPYKERNNLYRTGLDPESQYMKRLKEVSPEQYEAEKERMIKDKKRLEAALNCNGCLDSNSKFYNFASEEDLKAYPVKLSNDDVVFDLTDPMAEITWNWIKAHPLIAPSLEAYYRGDCPAECQYYIADHEAENRVQYAKKKEVNLAIIAFEKLAPTVKKRVARLMGLPVTEFTPEEEVYNIMDTALKEVEFKAGKHKGMSTVRIFNEIINLSDTRLRVKDLVEQALIKNIYRERGSGKIYEGEVEAFKSKEELITHLMDEANQDEFITLEKKLNLKKIAEV